MKENETVSAAVPGDAQPVSGTQRVVILDALRGLALMGIALANFPEFSLWTFLSEENQSALPSAATDGAVRWLHYLLVDGKFYTIFSLLFGIGFSIIIDHAMKRGADGFRIFFRRMLLLLLIGLAHMMLLWSGDILLLYAAVGLLLPLFRNCSGRSLLRWSAFFFLLPLAIDAWRVLSGVNPAGWLYSAWWSVAGSQGITEENFSTWLRDADSYAGMSAFLLQGAVERMWEFVGGQRYFRVLALFLLGYYIGRRQLYARLEECRPLLHGVARSGFLLGLPLSVVYAWSSMNGHPWGSWAHGLLYTLSVYPLGLGYMAGLCLLYLQTSGAAIWHLLAYPGRMALTCYIGQSVFGIVLFYGIGFGLGTRLGLWHTELVSLAVFAVETGLCALWFRYFCFGPLEWVWRMLTYGRRFPVRKRPLAVQAVP